MKTRKRKDKILAFRAPKETVKNIERLAKVSNVTRSEILRRLVPDVSGQKKE